MFGMFSGQGGWQLWESEGYELIISQDFLSDVRYVQWSGRVAAVGE